MPSGCSFAVLILPEEPNWLDYNESSSIDVPDTQSLRFWFENYQFRYFWSVTCFGAIFLFGREWDGIRMTFIKLSHYWYGKAVCEFNFLRPGTYKFDMLVTIIAKDYQFNCQAMYNIK